MVWVGSLETWLLILRWLLNICGMGLKFYQGISNVDHVVSGKTQIISGFIQGLQDHTEHQVKCKNCCPAGCGLYVDRVLKFQRNPRKKFWFVWTKLWFVWTHTSQLLLKGAWNHAAGVSQLWGHKEGWKRKQGLSLLTLAKLVTDTEL